MQSCLFTEYRYSPNKTRIRVSIATARPTTTRRWHPVVIFKDQPTTCHEEDANTNCKEDNITTLQLLRYLKLCKETYSLKDYDAMELLSFFKNNLDEAMRQLTINGGQSNMFLQLDIPWRLQAKAIHESPGIKELEKQKFFTDYKRIFIIDTSYSFNVLPQQPMAEQFAGRNLRIQRTFHGENLLQSCCVLPNKQEPLEVASLLLHVSDKQQLYCCAKLMEQWEEYLAPLLTATKSWTWNGRINHNVMSHFN